MGRGEFGHEPYSDVEEGLAGRGPDLSGIDEPEAPAAPAEKTAGLDEIEGMLREIADRPKASATSGRHRRKKRAGRSPQPEGSGRGFPSPGKGKAAPVFDAPAPTPPPPPAPAPEPAPCAQAEVLALHLSQVLGDASALERPIVEPPAHDVTIGGVDMAGRHEAEIPEHVPLAFDAVADAEEDPGAFPAFPCADVYTGGAAIAVAEPMTTHDAALVSLGENVKQVTMLIESVGRTLEAQNQRSLRLMERLEQVAKALETLPEEADRNLEAMDSVQEEIKANRAPLERMSDGIARLPDMFERLEESERRTRDMFSQATKAMASRMAVSSWERRREEDRQAGRRRWRTLAGAAMAALAFAGGLFFAGTDAGTQMRYAVGSALMGGAQSTAYADGNGGDKAPWRVTKVKSLKEIEEGLDGDDEWCGTDEQAAR